MAFSEPKTDWQASDVLLPIDFNRIEENTRAVREEPTLPLLLEVRSEYPAHAAGRAFYHTTDKRIYTSTGTGWV